MANEEYIRRIDNRFVVEIGRQLREWMPMGDGKRLSKNFCAYVSDEQPRPIKDMVVLVNCCIAEDEVFRLLRNIRSALDSDTGAVWNTLYSVAPWNGDGVGRIKGCTLDYLPKAGRSVYQHDDRPASVDGLCTALRRSLCDVEAVIVIADGNNILVGEGYKPYNRVMLVTPPYVEEKKAPELLGGSARFKEIPLFRLRPLPPGESVVESASNENNER